MGQQLLNEFGIENKSNASSVEVKFETLVKEIIKEPTSTSSSSNFQWKLICDNGKTFGNFDAVILTIPSPQAAPLLKPICENLFLKVSQIQVDPCWSVMIGLKNRLNVSFDGAFVHDSILSWIARNSSKPGRKTSFETWVLHGSRQWSSEHIDNSPDEAKKVLFEEFQKVIGLKIPMEEVLVLEGHRWRYAIPVTTLPDRFVWDDAVKIGLVGDYCGGPRIEGAFLSGLSLASHLKSIL